MDRPRTISGPYTTSKMGCGTFVQHFMASKCFQKAFELDAREADAARQLAEGFSEEREWDLVEVVTNRTIEGKGGFEDAQAPHSNPKASLRLPHRTLPLPPSLSCPLFAPSTFPLFNFFPFPMHSLPWLDDVPTQIVLQFMSICSRFSTVGPERVVLLSQDRHRVRPPRARMQSHPSGTPPPPR